MGDLKVASSWWLQTPRFLYCNLEGSLFGLDSHKIKIQRVFFSPVKTKTNRQRVKKKISHTTSEKPLILTQINMCVTRGRTPLKQAYVSSETDKKTRLKVKGVVINLVFLSGCHVGFPPSTQKYWTFSPRKPWKHGGPWKFVGQLHYIFCDKSLIVDPSLNVYTKSESRACFKWIRSGCGVFLNMTMTKNV